MKMKKNLVAGYVMGTISLSAYGQGMLRSQPESQAEEMVKEKDNDVLTAMPLSELDEIELPDLDKLNIGEAHQAKADHYDVQRIIDQYLYENMKEVDEPATKK
ncbi:hypothetical protein [[Clostridium] aminophilum]|uniref:hypothetical protein n=1 Tax=[Clostridium] aminophilum TaxID=1526 RepID=UPI0033184384